MMPGLDQRESDADGQNEMVERDLRSWMTNPEKHWQCRSQGRDNRHLDPPGNQIVGENRKCIHFRPRCAFKSSLISSRLAWLMRLLSTRWTSKGFVEPLKTRFTKSP